MVGRCNVPRCVRIATHEGNYWVAPHGRCKQCRTRELAGLPFLPGLGGGGGIPQDGWFCTCLATTYDGLGECGRCGRITEQHARRTLKAAR